MSLLLLFQGSGGGVGYNETGSCASVSTSAGNAIVALVASGSVVATSAGGGAGLIGLSLIGSSLVETEATGTNSLALAATGAADTITTAGGSANVGLVVFGSVGSSSNSDGNAIVGLVASGEASSETDITGTETAGGEGIVFDETGAAIVTTTATGTETVFIQESESGGGWHASQWQQFRPRNKRKEFNVSGHAVCTVVIVGCSVVARPASGHPRVLVKIGSNSEMYSPTVHASLLVALTEDED